MTAAPPAADGPLVSILVISYNTRAMTLACLRSVLAETTVPHELIVVDTMHTRKRTMAERSDAFVVLPGGYGTFEEMFEMLTWLQLQLHAKPVGVINVAGYFDRLLEFYALAEINEAASAAAEGRVLKPVLLMD